MKRLQNTPDLWLSAFPRPAQTDHKYKRGHSAIIGSDTYTGATRLAAQACSRIGSGLVTVVSDSQAQVYRATLPADIMVKTNLSEDLVRPSTLLAGPGGCNDQYEAAIRTSENALKLVLDADAIRLCGDLPHPTQIVTPHDGEFERYFGALGPDRSANALNVARERNVTVVLKGPKTLVAAPDGRVCENTAASPYLAKAGTGDVLAGLIAGLVAQGMPAFEAANAGVWLHGEASLRIGPGLIPQDLIAEMRPLLAELLS